MKNSTARTLAVGALFLAGCSSLQHDSKTHSQKSAIESVLTQRANLKAKDERAGLLSDQHVSGLMAIDVQGCPADFRSAWFDYLVEVENLRTRMERVAMIASEERKPVTDLPALIKLAVSNPTIGQYLLTSLDKVDEARKKFERIAMNYGVMPGSGGGR